MRRSNGITELAIPCDIREVDALPVLGTGKLDYVKMGDWQRHDARHLARWQVVKFGMYRWMPVQFRRIFRARSLAPQYRFPAILLERPACSSKRWSCWV